MNCPPDTGGARKKKRGLGRGTDGEFICRPCKDDHGKVRKHFRTYWRTMPLYPRAIRFIRHIGGLHFLNRPGWNCGGGLHPFNLLNRFGLGLGLFLLLLGLLPRAVKRPKQIGGACVKSESILLNGIIQRGSHGKGNSLIVSLTTAGKVVCIHAVIYAFPVDFGALLVNAVLIFTNYISVGWERENDRMEGRNRWAIMPHDGHTYRWRIYMNTMITEDTTTTDQQAIAELTRKVETLTAELTQLQRIVKAMDSWVALIRDGRLN